MGLVEVIVNGTLHRIDDATARKHGIDGAFTLVKYLREASSLPSPTLLFAAWTPSDVRADGVVLQVLELKGTKLGCGVGGCGVCTVMLTRPIRHASGQRTVEHVMVGLCIFLRIH